MLYIRKDALKLACSATYLYIIITVINSIFSKAFPYQSKEPTNPFFQQKRASEPKFSALLG